MMTIEGPTQLSAVRIITRGVNLLNGVAAASLGLIVIINGLNIFGRYFFSSPISWAEEAMLYLMVLTIFAGAAKVSWEQRHIRIDGIVAAMPVGLRRCAQIAILAVIVVVLSIVAVSSGKVVSMLFAFDQRSEALEIPLWIPQSVVTVGLALNGLLILAATLLCPEPGPHHAETGQDAMAQ